jgi:hypothetical protein
MYALLPAMRGASQEMHMQAIDQMIEYYRDDEDELRNQLLCFGTMMRRAEMLPTVELEEVLKKMQYYDPFIAGDAYLQALIARQVEEKTEEKVRIAEEKAEEKARIAQEQIARTEAGMIEALQNAVRSLLKVRFPLFAAQKGQEILLSDKIDVLQLLLVQISSAPDENVVRVILGMPPAVEIRSKSLEL